MKIEKDREYRFTGAWLRRFKLELERLQNASLRDEHPRSRQAQLDAVESQIEDLRDHIYEYRLNSGP